LWTIITNNFVGRRWYANSTSLPFSAIIALMSLAVIQAEEPVFFSSASMILIPNIC
jgi:hypothetical protein